MLGYRSCLCIRELSSVFRPSQLRCFASSANDGNGSSSYNDNNTNDMIASYQGADHEFGPYREREQAAECIDYHARPFDVQSQRDQPMRVQSMDMNYVDAESNRCQSMKMDSHIDNYDKQGTISLHSVMQSMVPEPFQPVSENQNPGPSNMPGGQSHQQISLRYTSEQRHGNNDPAGEIV